MANVALLGLVPGELGLFFNRFCDEVSVLLDIGGISLWLVVVSDTPNRETLLRVLVELFVWHFEEVIDLCQSLLLVLGEGAGGFESKYIWFLVVVTHDFCSIFKSDETLVTVQEVLAYSVLLQKPRDKLGLLE